MKENKPTKKVALTTYRVLKKLTPILVVALLEKKQRAKGTNKLDYDGAISKNVYGIWDGLTLSGGESNQLVRMAIMRVVPFDHGKMLQEKQAAR
ncbi:hypothetical protein CU097_010235 [Rhizopus azygosporus]|uniref:Uncharacterized protein n=1 Tax=Rhizopus azygosporus TaxID=86630 RepID=A0A367JV68_RHIAZ|nr:hypothetical protein CU097_010235 [Rhizopus azygosporus]